MPELAVSRVIACPAPLLWPLLGRFSRLPDWFPGVDGFSCEGDTPATGFIMSISLSAIDTENSRVDWQAKLAALPGTLPAGSESVFIERTRKNYAHALDHLEQVLARSLTA